MITEGTAVVEVAEQTTVVEEAIAEVAEEVVEVEEVVAEEEAVIDVTY